MVKNNQNVGKKIVFFTKVSKTFYFFGQKKKKIVIFFWVLLYGITPMWNEEQGGKVEMGLPFIFSSMQMLKTRPAYGSHMYVGAIQIETFSLKSLEKWTERKKHLFGFLWLEWNFNLHVQI